MLQNEQNNLKEITKNTSTYAKYVGLGFQMMVIIGVFTFVGYKIDENAGHDTKWVTAVLSLIGVFISLYLVIRSVSRNNG
ncbi:MAG: AtpZ/AtpI family protein [Bacteroidota bacterium]